jgi:hypothetical protein
VPEVLRELFSSFGALQDIAMHDFAFEEIVEEPKKQLQILAEHLGLADKASHIFA